MIEDFKACCVCGFPEAACPLIRLTWSDEPNGRVLVGGYRLTRMVVATKHPERNDVLVCEDCIREIKRLPFSDFAAVDIPF